MKKLYIKHSVIFNVVALAAGILLFYLVIRVSGKSFLELLKQTADVKYYYLAAVVAVSTLLSVFISKRWALLMSAHCDIRTLPKGFIFYNTNFGLLITSIFPIFGYMGTKSASFKLEHDVGIKKTLYATSLEYMMGISVIAAMILPSGLYVAGALDLMQGLIATGLASGLLLILFSLFSNRILKVFGLGLNFFLIRFANVPVIRDIRFMRRFTPGEFAPLNRPTAFKIMLLSLMTYFTALARGVIFLKAFNIDVNLGGFILLHVIGYGLSCIGLTPANIGVREMGWFGVLTYIGAANEHAALFAVGQRIINTGTTIVLAVAGYIVYALLKNSKKGSLVSRI